MNKRSLLVGLSGFLMIPSGCSSPPTQPIAVNPQPPAWTAPLSPDQVTKMSPETAKAILIAWTTLQQSSKQDGREMPNIMKFKAEPMPTGWSVWVGFVGAYVQGKPMGMPGGFCVVYIDTEWRVNRIVGGT